MSATSAHGGAGPILFLHIPKTAGTALRNFFAKQIGEERVTRGLPTMRLEDALIRYAGYDAICGHFLGEQGRPLPADRISMTILREPVDRFLSYFYFRKFDVQHSPVDQRVRAMDVDQFIDSLSENDMDDLNMQTSMLYPFGARSLGILPLSDRLSAAFEAIEQFDYIGIHSEIDDLACMICARFGWSPEQTLERTKVTSRRSSASDLAASSRKKLETFLEPDRLLFERASARFRQLRRRSILGPGLAAPRIASTPAMTDCVEERATPRVSSQEPREFGDRRLEFTSVWAVGEMSGDSQALIGETLHLYMEFIAHEAVDDLTAGFLIRDEQGLPVFGTNTHLLGEKYRLEPGVYSCGFSFVNRAERGEYTIDANLIRNGSHLEGCYHWKEKAARYDVHESAAVYFAGRVMMDASVTLSQVSTQGGVTVERIPWDASKPALSSGRFNPPLADFSARITQLSALSETEAGTELLVNMELHNTGTETWRAHGKRPVCLSYHWHDRDGGVIERDGLRTSLLRDVLPGETIRLVGLLRVPQRTGALNLIWTLVQEEVGWFDENNADAQCSGFVIVT